MDYIEKIKLIGSLAMLRVEQWKDEFGHWRGGINWYGEGDYDFICEKPTLEEVIDCILEHRDKWEKIKEVEDD